MLVPILMLVIMKWKMLTSAIRALDKKLKVATYLKNYVFNLLKD